MCIGSLYVYICSLKDKSSETNHIFLIVPVVLSSSWQGRYFVALSLEEGQHLRAAIHRLTLDQAVV